MFVFFCELQNETENNFHSFAILFVQNILPHIMSESKRIAEGVLYKNEKYCQHALHPARAGSSRLTGVVIGSLSGRVCRQLVTQKISGYTESPADMLMLKQDSHSSFSSHPDLIWGFFVLLQNIICLVNSGSLLGSRFLLPLSFQSYSVF